MKHATSLEVEVNESVIVAERVKRLRLVPVSGGALPAFSAGSHVVVTIEQDGRTFHNPYSLMGSLADNRSYQISVLHTEHSRGGSRYLHQNAQPGYRFFISYPINLFPIVQVGKKHVFVAGGIGITPFIPMMEELDRRNVPFELHYAVRTLSRGAYVEELSQKYGGRVKIYETGNGQRPSMDCVLSHQPLGTHLYVCGPERMMEPALSSARGAGWPIECLHTERFLGASGGRPFTVELAKSNRSVQVREHESLLEAIEAAGVEAPYLCRGGSCGQCETRILACDGTIMHKDHYLSAEERRAGSKLMICVSRLEQGTVVLDL